MPQIDARLGPLGLDPGGIHEVKPKTTGAGARCAALAFALRLAARRLQHICAGKPAVDPRILWCTTTAAAAEYGHLYGPGLAAFSLDPRSLIVAEAARTPEVLWAMEEGLRSGSLALVLGDHDDVGLTPARRLSLAAEETGTPCVLLTPAHVPGCAATATRWRIATAASATHAFDPLAPGDMRCEAMLERCRSARAGADVDCLLEWRVGASVGGFHPAAHSSQLHPIAKSRSLWHRTANGGRP